MKNNSKNIRKPKFNKQKSGSTRVCSPFSKNKFGDSKNNNFITGKNVIYEAIKSDTKIEEIYICEGYEDNFSFVFDNKKSFTKVLSKEEFDKMSLGLTNNKDQKIIAKISEFKYYTVDDILSDALDRGGEPFIILLDEITDPMNFGSIIRSANQAGAHGVIIKEKNNCELNNVVAGASSGALFYTKVAKVTNLSKTIDELKKSGIWFACADMDGENMYKANLDLPLGLVIGSEGTGVSRLVKEKCDFVVSIPMYGNIDSLNASVSAGILMYEIVRRNNFK